MPFLWVKLQLYSFALQEGILPFEARTELIVRGFETSYLFLEVFASAVTDTPLVLLPNLYPFVGVCAWMFILKVMYSRYQIYLDVESREVTDRLLRETHKVYASKGISCEDFCTKAGMMMETLLGDARRKHNNALIEPFLTIRSKMAAGLYYDGVARVAHLSRPREMSNSSMYEAKILLPCPPSATMSSHSSSPFMSSDDLSTPRTIDLTPSDSLNGNSVLAEFWDGRIVAEPEKVNMEWLADAFLQGQGAGAPGFVAPGLLMVQ
jgi:hypothetical protein